MIDYEKKLESISLSTIATKRNTSSSIDPQIINRPPTPSYEDTNSNHEILSPISPASPISEFVSGYFKKFNQPSILTPEQIQSRQLSIGHDLGRARIQFHNARSRLCDLANEVICKEEIVSLKKETDLTRHMNLIRKAYSRHYLKMAAIIDDNEE